MKTRREFLGLMAMGTGASLCAATTVWASRPPLKIESRLIWGTDDPKPKNPCVKDVAPGLRRKFRHIFKWKNYFKINEQQVFMPAGQTKWLRVSKKCELELTHREPDSILEIKLYGEGKLTKTVRQSVQSLVRGELAVLGGDDTDKYGDAWFVVISTPR